jgi:hypothetical protein
LDKTVKILLVVCCILVASLGITSGMVITKYQTSEPQNQITTQNITQNITQNQTSINKTTAQKKVKTVKTNNTNSKYITTICKRCGKTFTQPRDGPQYFYCDKCMDSPEVQREWEKETE